MICTVVVKNQTLAAQYLTTLLDDTSRVEVIGTATDGVEVFASALSCVPTPPSSTLICGVKMAFRWRRN